jgi:ketosteroid isomerase-like protein
MATSMKSTGSVLEHHLEAFGAGDLDAILEDYTDDSVIVSNVGTYRGLDEIRGFFGGLFAEFEQEGSELSLDEQIIEGDHAYIVWHASTPDNEYEFATDTFDIVDGIITLQTLGAKVTPRS